MKILWLLSAVSLFTLVIGQSSSTDIPNTSPTEPSTSTEVPTTHSTAPETTTTEKSTTQKPTTTTEPSSSTTDPPTTHEPTSTSPPDPPTTKVPEPECKWNVTQEDVTCIRADLQISFTIPLKGKDHHINLRCNATSEQSDCSSNDTQKLVLTDTDYKLTMVFNKESDKFYVRDIQFEYNLPDGADVVKSNTTKIFNVKIGKSYLCKTKAALTLGNVTMEIAEMHVQAFLQKDDKDFGAAEECEADDKVSDVVPIAVGVALAALIIIVLIAYLVGRRRSRQKGYQSV